MLQLIDFTSDEQLLNTFLKLPELLYASDSVRLHQKENINGKYVCKYFLVKESDEYIGRAILYNNPSLTYNGRCAWSIGNYECVENAAASSLLLDGILKAAKSKEVDFVIGPMNGSTWDDYRFNINRNLEPFFLESYHHLYYNTQFSNAGFEPISYYASSISHITGFESEINDVQMQFKEIGIKMHPVEIDHFEQELENLYKFCVKAFSGNYFYTPIDEISFKEKYIQAKAIIHPEFFQICTNKEGEVVGFIFCVDDFYNKVEKTLIIKTIARNKDEKYAGLGSIMGSYIYSLAKKMGYKKIIHAFMHVENASVKLSGKFTGVIANEYVLYGRKI